VVQEGDEIPEPQARVDELADLVLRLPESFGQAPDGEAFGLEDLFLLDEELQALLEERGWLFLDGPSRRYPEYTSTALTSFFDFPPEKVPGNAEKAYTDTKDEFAKEGLVAYPPTPFSSANGVGMLTEKANELGVTTISDLKGKSQDLTLYGSPECRQRIDCLLGLEQLYGLKFKEFKPVDIGLRYEVLDKGQADASILFTTDAQLSEDPEKYLLLEDDKGVLPAGNVLFVASEKAAKEAGPDFAKTIELVQQGLTLPVMQELNARVDIDKQKPEDVAADYLQSAGYVAG
jgi:glycine betaine/choline ABC-type transport system substrate-binding protein